MIRRWLAVLGALIGITTIIAGTAYALPNSFNGRVSNNGYLSNEYGNFHDWVFLPFPADQYVGLTLPNGGNTAADIANCTTTGCGDCNVNCTVTLSSFIAVYQARLNDSSVVDAGRAAAEIDMMLGQTQPAFTGAGQNGAAPAVPSTPGIVTGIAYAKAHFAQWSTMVTAIANNQVPGYSVDFNSYDFFPGTRANPGWNGMGVTAINDTGDITDCTSGQGCSGDISVYKGFSASDYDYDVKFNMPGTCTDLNGNPTPCAFYIKHKCANLTNDLAAFKVPTSSITITKSSDHPAAMGTGTQFEYEFAVDESANLPLASVSISDTIPAQFEYISTPAGDPVPTVSGQTLTWSFNAPADSAILANIAAGTENLAVTVQAVSAGNGIVNTATGTATDQLGNVLPVNPGHTVNTVFPPSQPVVVGQNSDVQAGGGLCDTAQTNGTIQGNLSGASMDQYVVSASTPGGISNFGSNNSISGSSNDTLKASGYEQVCREDLLTAAQAYYAALGSGIHIVAGSNFNVTGASGLYYYTGGSTLTVSGTITNKVTLVDLNGAGAVEINGRIALGAGTYLAADTPSLGIISAGDIDIDSSVNLVDAYLFANDNIHTCIQADSTCDNPLTVDGFLMAHDIAFERLGPPNSTGNPVSETITMTPQLYLNPPQFFDTSVDPTLLQGSGEQQPLF